MVVKLSSVTEELCGLADIVLLYFAALEAFNRSKQLADRNSLVKIREQLEKVSREVLRDYRGEQTCLFNNENKNT